MWRRWVVWRSSIRGSFRGFWSRPLPVISATTTGRTSTFMRGLWWLCCQIYLFLMLFFWQRRCIDLTHTFILHASDRGVLLCILIRHLWTKYSIYYKWLPSNNNREKFIIITLELSTLVHVTHKNFKFKRPSMVFFFQHLKWTYGKSIDTSRKCTFK